MTDTVLILGPVAFRNFEIPERVNFGGAQRLAIHRLPGGSRVIDTLGRDDAEICFAGTFTGADATTRARALDELRALGSVLPLTWDVFTYSVVIREFAAAYERPGWIPFRIACTVLRDEAAAVLEAPLSLAGAVLGDLATGSALAAGFGLAAIATALATPEATRQGSAAHAAARARLAESRDTIAAAIAGAEAQLDPDTLTTATRLDKCITTLEQLSVLTSARAYMGRAAANLTNAST